MEKAPEHIAAMDLGSNSFHMVVARLEHGEIRITEGLSEKVQLGAGLDTHHHLTEATVQRALDCLSRYAQRIKGLPRGAVRIVGTNTLRMARNAAAFLERAEQLLGHDIEIVSGREEARLIYLGVAHTLADDAGKRLVVDIGGGSTEFIIGERFEALETESLHMGCVSFTQRFFADGRLEARRFDEAVMAARQEVLNIEGHYRDQGWDEAVGASGTIKAVEQVCLENGWETQGIHLDSLWRIREQLLACGTIDQLALPGLRADRAAIFPAGVAILLGLFQQLGVTRMTVSSGALREGVLYDLLGRFQHEDVRERTVQAQMERYHVDRRQAARVSDTVQHLYRCVAGHWMDEADTSVDLLRWAACLHEVGLSISHSQFHKHGGYILQHADLPGFSRQQQLKLAWIVRYHRRKLQRPDARSDLEHQVIERVLRKTLLLRLAVLLHHARSDEPLPALALTADEHGLTLSFPEGWLRQHPLTLADFEQEQGYWQAEGLALRVI